MRTRAGERGGLIVRLAGLVFLAIVALALFFSRFVLMRMAGEWLVVSDALQPSNAIIVLSGDDLNGDRAARAAQLYKAGWAPVVVASGSEIRPYLSEADLETRDLESDGVPAKSIVPLRQRALYTLEESRDLLQLCRSEHWKKVIVVTSNFHTRRARYIFQHVFPPSIEVRVTPASDVDFRPGSWWETREGMKTFARETAALCVAFWELHTSSVHAKMQQQTGDVGPESGP
ncbi:MAG: YdcF family protein [Acidobacteriota bacterium]|nr:YdcF family protein [Acidobacteriota bacterium]